MTAQEFESVRDTVDNEGFDYAFRHYSNFNEISDERFHELREKYVEAANLLAQYLGLEG